MKRLAAVIWFVLLPLIASAQDTVSRPSGEPVLRAEDERASIELWAELPTGSLDLLGRFEAVIEIHADGEVRIEGWSVRDALGDEVLVSVLDEMPLARASEVEGWFGRYRVVVEPLLDGNITLGPVELTYLIDPDPETDPTQLEPTRIAISSESIVIAVSGPGGEVPQEARPAKAAAEPEEEFNWQLVLIAGVSMGVVLPIVMALVLAVRTTKRRTRDESPRRCVEQLEGLERVVRAGGPSGMAIDGVAVAGEALASVRTMLDQSLGLRTRGMSGPEMLGDPNVRSTLSADGYERLRGLVQETESVRFAGGTLEEGRALELVGSAKQIARAVERQRGGGGA